MDLISWQSFLYFLIIPLLVWSAGESRRAFTICLFNLIFLVFWLRESSAIVLTSSFATYFIARRLQSPPSKRAHWWLAFGILITLGPLILFRWPLEAENISRLRGIWMSGSLAFFCLQSCGALLEIYWNRAEPPRTLARWMAFSIFFPNLLAGPIARWKELGATIDTPMTFNKEHGNEALLLFGQGLFKKMVLAAPFLFILDRYFTEPLKHGWVTAIGMAFLLRYAIWAEISSHTDWARAGAHLLGYRLPNNFHYPFQTLRLAEFWRRWHMSLSLWLQDYVFSPIALGPLRRWISPKLAMVVALMVAFSGLGLWHGITVSFLAMGFVKGLGVLISEWSWRNAEKQRGWLFLIYRATVAPAMLLLFLVLPTLLIRTDLATLLTVFSKPDHGLATSWLRLTEIYDGDSLIHRTMYPYLLIAIGYEGLLWLNRRRQASRASMDVQSSWDFAALSPWPRGVILLIGFILFLIFAEFEASLGFSYVNH